jgi:hypothetical protein
MSVLVFCFATLCGLVGEVTSVSEEHIPYIFRENLNVEALLFSKMLGTTYKTT